jgi:hypothetical protein
MESLMVEDQITPPAITSPGRPARGRDVGLTRGAGRVIFSVVDIVKPLSHNVDLALALSRM